MSIKPEHRMKVGDWWCLPERDKLVKLDATGQLLETAELDNLCQNVMNYLMVHAGELVSKDELLEKVWGIRAVSDGRITRVIRVLRVALGDDSRTPTYIETVPKRGYRLVAAIEQVSAEPLISSHAAARPAAQQASPPTNTYAAWRARIYLAGFILLPLLLAGYFWWASNPEHDELAATPLWRYEPVTFLDGIEFYHSISPDEKLLAFSYASSPSDNVVKLKIQNLQNHQVTTLTDAPYSSFGAAWSPDGMQLAYQRVLSGRLCEIRLLTLTAGRDQVLADELLTRCGAQSISARLSWSPDGRFLVYPSREEGQGQMALVLYPVQGGQPQILTAPPASGFGDYAARFSRDGSRLAFLRYASGSAELWVLDLSSRSTRMLVRLQDFLPGNIDWSLNDQEIIYPTGRASLGAVDVATGQTRLLAYTDNNARELQISASGRLLASVGAFSQLNIVKVPNEVIRPQAEQSRQIVFSSNRSESFAEASPLQDGPVAVVSRRSGVSQVWLFKADGSQEQLTHFTENERFSDLRFSPDGRNLLALISQQLWILAEGVEPRRIPTKGFDTIANPSWSRDGQHVFFAVARQGQWQMMQADLNASLPVQLFHPERELYLESPNGRYQFWRNSVDHGYFLAVDAEPAIKLELAEPGRLPLRFIITNQGLYFSSYLEDNKYQLYYLDFSNTEIQPATTVDTLYFDQFSLSADGRYFYVPSMAGGDTDIAEISVKQQNL